MPVQAYRCENYHKLFVANDDADARLIIIEVGDDTTPYGDGMRTRVAQPTLRQVCWVCRKAIMGRPIE